MKVLLHQGKDKEVDIPASRVIADLRGTLPWLHSLTIDDLVEFFDTAAAQWRASTAYQGALKPLAQFMERKAFTKMLSLALRGDISVLEGFIDLGDEKNLFHCQPRGLAVHWLAGNVPILGLYSVVQALATKNVSLLKASGRAHKELVEILCLLKDIKTSKISGEDLLKTICVALVDSDDRKNHEELSRAADIRIAWGGKEAVDAVLALPKQFWCEDIVYGPKYSFGVIDKESLSNYKELVKRLAFDICTFDQQACSSPHTLFIEETPEIPLETFAEELARAIEKVSAGFIPKAKNDPYTMDVAAARAKYMMRGKVFTSKTPDWTVIVSRESGLADPVFSRVIFVRPITDARGLAGLVDHRKQTLGAALAGEDREQIIDEITREGIDRCPAFGDMTRFESPWDGSFAVDRMVRWVTLSKKR